MGRQVNRKFNFVKLSKMSSVKHQKLTKNKFNQLKDKYKYCYKCYNPKILRTRKFWGGHLGVAVLTYGYVFNSIYFILFFINFLYNI